MKLKMLVVGDEDNNVEFFDLYMDESEILGFYVPSDFLEYGEPVINLFFKGGSVFTVKTSKELKKYLDKKFDL